MQLTMPLNDWNAMLLIMCEAEHSRTLKIDELRRLGTAYTALRQAINQAMLVNCQEPSLRCTDETRDLLVKVCNANGSQAARRLLARLRGGKLTMDPHDPTTPQQRAEAARLRKELTKGELG